MQTTFVSVHDAAQRMGVSIGTIRRYVRLGELPATRTLGGHLRIAIADIDSLIERGRREVEEWSASV